MAFRTFIAALALGGLTATGAVAQARDSDGDVISVITWNDVIFDKSGNVYYVMLERGGVTYRFDLVADGGGPLLPTELEIGGETFSVAPDGDRVLLDPVGGAARVVARVRRDRPAGVNPQVFGLE